MDFGDAWTAEQSVLADVLMNAWAQHARWPIFQYVSSELATRGIKDAVGVLRSFPDYGDRSPTSRSYCDVRFDHTYPAPPADSEVSLSVSGLARHHAGDEMAEAFVAVLAYAAKKYAQTPMDATRIVEVEVSSEELAATPGHFWPDYLLHAAGVLLKTEWPSGIQHMGGPQDAASWTIHVGQDVLRYTDATVGSYIDGIKRDIESAASDMSKWHGSAAGAAGDEAGEVTMARVQRMSSRRAVVELAKLKQIALDDPRVRVSGPAHEQWKAQVRAIMERSLGPTASVLHDFNAVKYHVGVWTGAPGEAEQDRQYFASKVDSAIAYIDAAAFELELDQDPETATTVAAPVGDEATGTIFLVHGHDEGLKSAVARLIERATSAEVVILHEQADQGKTVIEKFEAHAQPAMFAVVLLTPDDEGRVKGGDDWSPRARQNVVLEHGYFIGRLGRSRVVALYKGDVELPSDLSGLIYKPVDDGGAWKFELAKELRAAKIEVDMNKIA